MPEPDLHQVLALASTDGRICPKPPQWGRLYELLPDTRSDAYGSIPSEPLILAAWSESSDEDKRYRLKEHLEWAAGHGALERVHKYLATLREQDWHHVGD
jgi:hypothetical protein